MKNIFICLIRAYQVFISPFFPPSCRFIPSCSHYTIQAIKTNGVFWGIKLGLFRVVRCHPFHPGGWDPVPPVKW